MKEIRQRSNTIPNIIKANEDGGHPSNAILIIDTVADQSTCAGPAWTVLEDTGLTLRCTGYMGDNQGNNTHDLPVVSAITCVEMEGEQPILLLMHQACFYENQDQRESLCHPYQSMEHRIKFCLTPKDALTPDGSLGKQSIMVNDREISLKLDGRKMYLNIRKPMQDEIDTLDTLEMTSPLPFEPEMDESNRKMSRRDTKRK